MKKLVMMMLVGLISMPLFAQKPILQRSTFSQSAIERAVAEAVTERGADKVFLAAYGVYVTSFFGFRISKAHPEALAGFLVPPPVALMGMAEAYMQLPPRFFVMGPVCFEEEWKIGDKSVSKLDILAKLAERYLPEEQQERFGKFLQRVNDDIRLYHEYDPESDDVSAEQNEVLLKAVKMVTYIDGKFKSETLER